jgi:MFS family permease
MSTTPLALDSNSDSGGNIYNKVFWLSYAANAAMVTANALTFRFAEFVSHLGGDEVTAGAIVSAGMIGALVARLGMGQTIDHYGTRIVWPAASVLFIAACTMFVVGNELSWVLYAARVTFAVGLAGMVTCSMVHIQNQVPAYRRTEVIGSLGSSGFIGMIAGTQFGDMIFHFVPDGRLRYVILFGSALVLALFYLVTVVMLTLRDGHEPPERSQAAHKLLFRFWPGNVVLAAIMIGVAFTVISVFLTRFATSRRLGGIGPFFASFCVWAFFLRVIARRWSRTIGRHRLILLGLTGQAIGMATLPWVTRSWQFMFPAIGYAFGHALLFPSVVSLGAGAFPKEYRGTGTTIVLGFTEIGAMISAQPLGWMIVEHGFGPMFLSVSIAGLLVAGIYFATEARKHDEDVLKEEDVPNNRDVRQRDSDDEGDVDANEPSPRPATESITVPMPLGPERISLP